MEREIKFRAWDIDCNKYRGIKGVSDLFSIRSDGKTLGNYVLEQFTGLKDKNGVDIYEGDIVKFHTTRYHETKEVHQRAFLSKVIWNEGCFMVNESFTDPESDEDYDTFLTCLFPPYTDGDFEPEIIGNIHEK